MRLLASEIETTFLLYTIYGSDLNSGPLTSQKDVSWFRPYFWRPYTFGTIATGIGSH